MVSPLLHAILSGRLPPPGKCTLHGGIARIKLNNVQDVAAACVFLATKTEECGRKLRDVARVYCSKVWGRKTEEIADDSQVCSFPNDGGGILTRICRNWKRAKLPSCLLKRFSSRLYASTSSCGAPHADLVDLLEARQESNEFEEYAFTIANDSSVCDFPMIFSADGHNGYDLY